jgi:L-alanine-DL-glutamate epimerase-like enolase superfamily enzyme
MSPTGTTGKVDRLETAVYRFPTPQPEADGTYEWSATVAVVVRAFAGDVAGLGWTYSTGAAASLVPEHLAKVVVGRPVDDVAACWEAMHRECRNLGTRGLAMQMISAVDIALWDLKARCADLPLARVFGTVRDGMPVYGSGGFTTLSDQQLAEQVATWRTAGCGLMKIKIGENWGRRVDRDLERVARLREFAGPDVLLMADANGAYSVGQAKRVGAALDDLGVVWFEEPVSSDDLDGLRLLRSVLRCDVAAGEYAAEVYDAAALCGRVDCLQLDVTRCGGYTGFARCAAVAAAHNLQVSGHCAPSLTVPIGCATVNLRHTEWFIDHARLEPELVDGVPPVTDGLLRPVLDRPGHGYTLRADAERYRQT